jgi:hypothetical protein
MVEDPECKGDEGDAPDGDFAYPIEDYHLVRCVGEAEEPLSAVRFGGPAGQVVLEMCRR